jgi:hypothetical protein
VTYARRAAGIAAVETLNGKKADNSKLTVRGNIGASCGSFPFNWLLWFLLPSYGSLTWHLDSSIRPNSSGDNVESAHFP